MATLKPYAGLSPARLTALMNKDNHDTLRLGVDFTFGIPAAYSDVAGRNTKLVITPMPGKPYDGPQELHYWRLGLDAMGRLPVGEVAKVQLESLPFSIHDALPAINAALGLNLTTDEVEDDIFLEMQATYPLTITDSLAWLPGSVFNFQVHFANEQIPLDQAIANNELNGFDYARPARP